MSLSEFKNDNNTKTIYEEKRWKVVFDLCSIVIVWGVKSVPH